MRNTNAAVLNEAVKRLHMLGLGEEAIELFEEGVITTSDFFSIAPMDDVAKKAVRSCSGKGCHPYHVIQTGFLYNVLYVCSDPDEWEMEREDLKEGYPIAFVLNAKDNIGEFGSIGIRAQNCTVVRIA